jgi:hypothetical protein
MDNYCPICDDELTRTTCAYLDRWCLMEESYRCDRCKKYSYDYVTGYTRECFGKYEFTFSYEKCYSLIERAHIKILITYFRFLIGIRDLFTPETP